MLDDERDGIEQILTALQGKSNLAAIDIISHGSPGSITLGSGVLNISNLNSYESQLLQIGRHLAENGDILLYGCKVAQGEIGLDFIEQLSELTGSDVAASTSLTGATEMGGNWLLEAQAGSIQAQAMRFDCKSVLADDFPDTAATTGTIAIGGSSSGSFEESLDRDWFRASLEAGQTYEFQATGEGPAFTELAIYDADSTLLSEGGFDGNNRDGESLIYTATKTGAHFLEASTLTVRSFEPSSYTISATQNVIEIALPDDYPSTTDTTGSVSIGGSSSGNIEERFDLDWFQVSLVAGHIYEFQLNSESIATKLDLHGTEGNFLGAVFDIGSSSALFTFAPQFTGTYYLQASSSGTGTAAHTGDYTISAIQTSLHLDDYSNTIDTTGSLEIGGGARGIIETAFDTDWFKLSLTAGHTYEFRLDSEEFIPFFALYDSDGSAIYGNQGIFPVTSGGNLDFTAINTDTYYLDVGASLGSRGQVISDGGDYTVFVSEDSSSLRPSVDQIFNWAESIFREQLPTNVFRNDQSESAEILGYYARIYDNGNAVGELDENLYFYNGDSIVLVGTVNDYLSDAIDAGF